MDQKTLIIFFPFTFGYRSIQMPRLYSRSIIFFRKSWYATFSTTTYNKFAFCHFGKINVGILFPKPMQFKRTLITQNIVIKIIIKMIPICRCLSLNDHQIFDILFCYCSILQHTNSSLYLTTCCNYLLSLRVIFLSSFI